MSRIELTLPAMYADHHTTEVRRILFEIPGVEEVFASSSLHTVQVRFDPAVTDPDTIRAALEAAGYTEAPVFPVESSIAEKEDRSVQSFARHTAAYQQVKSVVSFSQTVNYTGRPLWPCPGMGVIRLDRLEEDVGNG